MTKKMQTPQWLLEKQPASLKGTAQKRRGLKQLRFIDKTINEVMQVVQDEYYAGLKAREQGLMQLIEPRVKLVTVVYLIIITNIVHNPATMLLLNIWILFIAKLSHISVFTFLKRVWPVVFLFTGIVVFPSIFNYVRPGTPLITVFDFGHPVQIGRWVMPETFSITKEGAVGALTMLLRVGTSVSLAVLLALTTRWNELLKALRMFFVPQLFIQVLEMTHRYIYLLIQTAADMFLAKKSRTIGRYSAKKQRNLIASSIGTLWSKAYYLSEEIHSAMISRGYSGEIKTLKNQRISFKAWVWLAFVVLIGLLALGGDRLFG